MTANTTSMPSQTTKAQMLREDLQGQGAGQTEEIDADELEAMKREREEMIAAAGGEDRLESAEGRHKAQHLARAPSIASNEAEAL